MCFTLLKIGAQRGVIQVKFFKLFLLEKFRGCKMALFKLSCHRNFIEPLVKFKLICQLFDKFKNQDFYNFKISCHKYFIEPLVN